MDNGFHRFYAQRFIIWLAGINLCFSKTTVYGVWLEPRDDLTDNYLGSYTFHSLMGVVNLVILALFSLRIYRSRRSSDTAGAQY